MGTKSARAGIYAVPAAPGPIMAATIGTTPDMMDSSRKRKPDPAKVGADRLLDPRARRVDEPDHGHPLAEGDLPRAVALDLGRAPHGARHDREVVGDERGRAPVDLAESRHHAIGGGGLSLPVGRAVWLGGG